MNKKMVVGLMLVVLLGLVGYGVFYFSGQPSRAADQVAKLSKADANPMAKLVYTGTNETLSEALYHMDLKDG